MLQKKITIKDTTIYISGKLSILESILTMPSKEVDSCSDDDESIVLEGGKHMYYLWVCLVSCVTCALGAF